MKEFKSFFKTVVGNEGSLCKYPTRLDVYGCCCAHDCSYCYAKSLLSFRGLWNPEEPSVADLKKVERKIAKLPKGSVVRLGGMTDCLQPIEAKTKATLHTIEMLNYYGVGYLIVTKSHLITRDDFLWRLHPDLAHVQITVTNTDDRAALQYEKCSLSSKRLEAVKTLQDKGVDVALRLSPFVSEFIDIDVLKRYEPKKVIVEFLRVNHWIEKWLAGIIDLRPYTLRSGGYRHLPLEEKQTRLMALKTALDAEFSVCEDVPEHWKVWRDHFNVNPGDCCNLRVTA